MKILLLVLLLVLSSSSSAQSIVISGGGQSIAVSGSAAVDAVPSAASVATDRTVVFEEVTPKPVVAEKPKPVVIPSPVQNAPRRYLAMFTASYCGPCQDWKRSVLPQLQSAGYRVEQIEMTNRSNQRTYGGQISRYPSFVVCDWETGRWVSGITVGYVDLATAKRMLGGSSRMESQPVARVVSSSGRATPQATTVRQRLPVVDTKWGRIDLESYQRNCNCSMCQGIRALQQQYRSQYQPTLFVPESPKNLPPGQQPTPDEVIDDMLTLTNLTSADILGDIGCGDGRILIAAARRYGCRGVGIEIDETQARRARQAVAAAGLDGQIRIITGDARKLDLQSHGITAITLYLFPELLAELAPKLKFARVVASPFHAIPGLQMTQYGDVWLYRQQNQMQPQQTTGITQIQIPGFDRTAEINHLMDPASPHAGKFIRSNLERLTDMQLIDLHNREHGLHTVDGVLVSSR